MKEKALTIITSGLFILRENKDLQHKDVMEITGLVLDRIKQNKTRGLLDEETLKAAQQIKRCFRELKE